MRKTLLIILPIILLLITACGGGEAAPATTEINNDTGSDTAEPTEETTTDNADDANDAQPAPTGELPDYGLEAGGYTLSFEGDLETGEGYTGTRDRAVDYDPFSRASNAEGPMDVVMRWDGMVDGERVDLAVTIVMREEITPGTHAIGDSISSSSEFDVRAYVDVDATGMQDFRENVSGTLTLDSADRQLANGSFEFTAETEDGLSLTTSGSFHAIPFSRQPESELTFSGPIGDTSPSNQGSTTDVLDDGRYRINLRYRDSNGEGGLMLVMPANIAAGSHAVGEGENVEGLWGFDGSVSGTLELTEVGDLFSGSLDTTVSTEDGESGITGSFEAMPGPDA